MTGERTSQRIEKNEIGQLTPMDLFMRDVSRYELLDADGEKDLAIQMEAGLIAEARLCDPARELMTPAEQDELNEKVQLGAQAKDTFINSNLRLVISIARRHRDKGLELLDLIQEGMPGLIRAVEKFDHRQGYKFSTYGTWWIQQSITRAIGTKGKTIKLPVHLEGQLLGLWKTAKHLGKRDIDQEVLDFAGLNMSVDRYRQIMAQGSPLSLDSPVSEHGHATFADYVPSDIDEEGVFVADQLLEEFLVQVFGELEREVMPRRTSQARAERQRTMEEKLADTRGAAPVYADGPMMARIIRIKFFEGGQEVRRRKMTEIAEELGMSREKARPILRYAIEMMQVIAEELGYEEDEMNGTSAYSAIS